jgi:hypothetical protein
MGTVVVANVKVKARDERMQAAVQKVVAYSTEEAFDPALLTVENGNGSRAYGNGFRRNGNGNGGTRDQEPGASPPITPEASQLRIVLEETDDAEGDQERLRALVNAVRDYAGDGEVRLSIRQRDGEEVVMELPPARFCPELTARLGEIVGPWGTVRG